MKFPNIDFDAINNMINNMSEEEKSDMMNMAKNMMNDMDLENMVPQSNKSLKMKKISIPY